MHRIPSQFRSHLFSMSQTKLALHENFMVCVIFCERGSIRVADKNIEVEGSIICIKPDRYHSVVIPQGGAEILYLDGVKLPDNQDDFTQLCNDWTYIPEAFHNKEHCKIDTFRNYLNAKEVVPDKTLLTILEELYTSPLNRMTQDELAIKLGLERSQALKYFKDVTGQTFRRFKKWAASISVTSNVFQGQIIGHAGIDAGFSDAAHISKTAKALFGITPSVGINSLRNISTLVKYE